jgi:hypothetical protein
MVGGVAKGKHDITVDGKVITMNELLREGDQENDGCEDELEDFHDKLDEDGGHSSDNEENISSSYIADCATEDFVDALEHLTFRTSEFPAPVAPAVAEVPDAAASTNIVNNSGKHGVNSTSQTATRKARDDQNHTEVPCCRDSAVMFWNGLMSLPRELREMVFAAYLADLPSTIILRPHIFQKNHRFPAIVPALCYVNKQVFEESVPMLLRNKQIIVATRRPAPSVLTNFLDRVPGGKGFKAVTILRSERLYYTHNWTRTFHLCHGLQHLCITVHAIAFLNFLDDSSFSK